MYKQKTNKKVPNRPWRCQYRVSSFFGWGLAQGQTIEINGGKPKHERRHYSVVVGDVSKARTSGLTRDNRSVQNKRRETNCRKKYQKRNKKTKINEQRKSSVSKKYICINDGISKKYQNLCGKRCFIDTHIEIFQHHVSMKGCLRL